MDRIEERNGLVRQMVAEGCTYAAIGTRFSLSRERVRQIAGELGIEARSSWKSSAKRRSERLSIIEAKPGESKTASKTGLKLARLRELLTYNRYTGLFRWRVNRGPCHPGDIAGTQHEAGYIQIRIDYKLYMAHVLAWFYSFEQWPENLIDHENRIRDDNRLDNLRQATYSQNLVLAPFHQQLSGVAPFEFLGGPFSEDLKSMEPPPYTNPTRGRLNGEQPGVKLRPGGFNPRRLRG